MDTYKIRTLRKVCMCVKFNKISFYMFSICSKSVYYRVHACVYMRVHTNTRPPTGTHIWAGWLGWHIWAQPILAADHRWFPFQRQPELQRPVRGGRQRADSGDFLEGKTRGPQVSRVMGGGMPCWGLGR